jgi:hypothetical protein
VDAEDISTDIIFVDKKTDLNVYKENDHGQGSSCCTTTDYGSDKGSFCYSTTESKQAEYANQKGASEKAENIDFNEWASK